MKSHDPDKPPERDETMAALARGLGLKVVHVICLEPGEEVDATGVSFHAMVDVVPRVGESIVLEDGTVCEVNKVLHKLVRSFGKAELTANIVAYRLPAPSK